MISVEALYSLGALLAAGLLGYLVYALLCAEGF